MADGQAPQRKDQQDDHRVSYHRPSPVEVAKNQIAFHFDELCRLIGANFDGPNGPGVREVSIVKLKLEDALVWMLHTGIINRPNNIPGSPDTK